MMMITVMMMKINSRDNDSADDDGDDSDDADAHDGNVLLLSMMAFRNAVGTKNASSCSHAVNEPGALQPRSPVSNQLFSGKAF